MDDKKTQIHFWYVIAAVLLMLFIQSLYLQSTKLTPIPYSRFQTLLNQDKVEKIAIAEQKTTRAPSRSAIQPLTGMKTARLNR